MPYHVRKGLHAWSRRLNALIWYNAWPEHPIMERWEQRFNWLGRWLCCNLGGLLMHPALFAKACKAIKPSYTGQAVSLLTLCSCHMTEPIRLSWASAVKI